MSVFETIPTIEPSRVTAGDVLRWSRPDLVGVMPVGSTLRYVFVIPGAATLTVNAAEPDFSAVVSSIQTANWPTGSIRWTAFAVDGAERRELARGLFVVDPNPEAAAAGVDQRSHAEKTLAAIEAVIEKRATQLQMKQTLSDGRSIEMLTFAEALRLRSFYRREVENERRLSGATPYKSRNLLVRFK